MEATVPQFRWFSRKYAKYKSRQCNVGGTQKLTKATQKHPANANTSTKSGSDTATMTHVETKPYRTIARRSTWECRIWTHRRSSNSEHGTINNGAVAMIVPTIASRVVLGNNPLDGNSWRTSDFKCGNSR